jgi:cell division septal protein FtsQ
MQKNPKIFNTGDNKSKNSSFSIKSLSTIFKLLIILSVIIGILYFIFYSSFFTISNLEIEGTQLASQKDVRQLSLDQISQSRNIWKFNDFQLEQKIKNDFPVVDQVIVQKGIPNTIRVKVTEREPVIIWKVENKSYLVDKVGIPFSDVKTYQNANKELSNQLITVRDTSKLPVKLNQRLVTSNWINFIIKIDRLLINEVQLPARRYQIKETAFDVYAISDKGKLIFDSNRPAEEQISALNKAVNSINKNRFTYLDLRIKGWVYYK